MSEKRGKALEVRGLVKRYPRFILGPLDLDLEVGTVLAFVGSNGAGKTTTLDCLMGLRTADEGRVDVFEQPNRPDRVEWKLAVGYVGEESGFYRQWTVAKNLRFIASFYPGWDEAFVGGLLRRLSLPTATPVKALSKGNKAKLALVAALGHRPRLLLLDEPLDGFDPVVREEVLDILWELVETGEASILFSTHVLADVSRIADEVAFLAAGRVLLRSPRDHLEDSWRRITFRSSAAPLVLPAALAHRVHGGEHRLVSWDQEATLSALAAFAPQGLTVSRMGLEEISVAILKEPDRVAPPAH